MLFLCISLRTVIHNNKVKVPIQSEGASEDLTGRMGYTKV